MAAVAPSGGVIMSQTPATVASIVKFWTQNVKSTTEVPQNTLEGYTKLSQL